MQTLESMRRRIQSAEDLHGVVRVMKALAAVGIRQYETAVESLAEYSRTIELGLQVALRHRPEEFPAREPHVGTRWGGIVFGSDQGMCGSFNEQCAAFALDGIQSLPARREQRVLLVVGTRIVGRLEDAGVEIDERYPVPSAVAGITPLVNDVVLKIEKLRFQRGVDRFFVFHRAPVAAASSRMRQLQLLPVDPQWLRELTTRPWPTHVLPTFTMDWRPLISALIRQHLFVALYRAVAESLACENAFRLASMQAAEKNIEDHLTALTGRYHQERQQSITEELLDIVAGFETITEPG